METVEPKVLADGAEQLAGLAGNVLRRATGQGLRLATAESCTGGLLASLLTDIEGLSGCFERGFVVYTNEAKSEMLGIDPIEIARHGAVSREVALLMARGALAHSGADAVVAITGFAGPASPGDEVGLVHLAACDRRRSIHRECHFGKAGRDRTRQLAALGALELLNDLVSKPEG